MGIPRRRALATFGGSLVTLAGCSSPGPPPVPSLAETLEPEVTAFLAGRTAALHSGDRDAWLAGVDTANTALVEHEKMVFGNLRQFDFTSVEFRRGPDPGGTPQPGRYASSLPMRSLGYDVQLVMRLRDVDAAPTPVGYRYVFGLIDGAFTMVDVAPAAADPSGLSRVLVDCPWDLSPLRVRRLDDLVIATEAGITDLDDLVADAGRASQAVRRDWADNPAPAAVALFVTAGAAGYRRWFGGGPAWSDGRTVPAPPDAESAVGGQPDGRYAGSRSVVNLAASTALASPYETISRHLTYALSLAVLPVDDRLRALPDPASAEVRTPLWAVEGFARYLAGRDSAETRNRQRAVLRTGPAVDRLGRGLAGNADFYAERGREVNCALAYSLFQFVASRWSHARALALYQAVLTAHRPDPVSPAAALSAALGQTGLVDRPVTEAATAAFGTQWTRFVQQL